MTTPLYPSFEKRIDDAINKILREQIEPWAFFNAGYPVQLTACDGRKVSLQGYGFEGSPRQVFWSRYIEPCLENLALQEITAAVTLARERKVNGRLLLREVEGLLLSGSKRVFQRMAQIDRRLRGKGFPQSVQPRSVSDEVDAMKVFLEKHIRAEIEMWSVESTSQPFSKEREQKFGIVCSLAQADVDFTSFCKAAHNTATIGVLFLDVDNFKSLNSRFTETVVDEILLSPFQTLLRDACVGRGECYRHGGDEFLILLPNQTADEVAAFAKRLQAQVAAKTFVATDQEVRITISIGVSLWPRDGSTFKDLVSKANKAEHNAKSQGKNRVVFYADN